MCHYSYLIDVVFVRVLACAVDDLVPYCDTVVSSSEGESTEECRRTCTEIIKSCEAGSSKFLTCVNEQRAERKFDENCLTKEKQPGRGIVFCKLQQKPCVFSEWGQWSDCTFTCRSSSNEYDDSFRTRTRQIIKPGSNTGDLCGGLYNESTHFHINWRVYSHCACTLNNKFSQVC